MTNGPIELQSAATWKMKSNEEDPFQAIESVLQPAISTQKIIRNGQLFIEQNGRTYSILGNQIH